MKIILVLFSAVTLCGCMAMVEENYDNRQIKSFMVPSKQVGFVLEEGDKIPSDRKRQGQLRVFESKEDAAAPVSQK